MEGGREGGSVGVWEGGRVGGWVGGLIRWILGNLIVFNLLGVYCHYMKLKVLHFITMMPDLTHYYRII